MDTSNGDLYTEEQYKELSKNLAEEDKKRFKVVGYATPEQIQKMKVGRNQKCPCGSNRKFKNCCLV